MKLQACTDWFVVQSGVLVNYPWAKRCHTQDNEEVKLLLRTTVMSFPIVELAVAPNQLDSSHLNTSGRCDGHCLVLSSTFNSLLHGLKHMLSFMICTSGKKTALIYSKKGIPKPIFRSLYASHLFFFFFQWRG